MNSRLLKKSWLWIKLKSFSSSTPSGLEAANSPSTPNLHSGLFMFNPFGISYGNNPWNIVKRLLPPLKGLNINSHGCNPWDIVKRFPPTLKGLNINSHGCNPWDIVKRLPPTLKGLNVNSHGCNPWNIIKRLLTTLKGLNLKKVSYRSTPSGLEVTNSPFPPNFHSGLFTFNTFGIRRQIQPISFIADPSSFITHHSSFLVNRSLIACLFTLLTFFSCQQESINPPIEVEEGFKKGVFITNEGKYIGGNASVTFYDPIEKIIQEKIFETANNQPLGDVLQSMTVIEDKAYLVVNNSQKVEIVSMQDFSSIGTIDGLISPRYLTPINETTAYVSDIFGAAIAVVDLESKKEMTQIPFGSSSEEMVKINEDVFVTQPSLFLGTTKKSSNQLFIINTVTNEVTDSIQVGYNPIELEVDKNNQVWVICNGEGNFGNPDKLGGLYRINPETKIVEVALPFSNSSVSFAPRLAMNAAKDQLYFLKLDVFNLAIDATTLPSTPLIEANGRDIYGLGVNPANGHIYVGDSGRFNQRGTVTIHDTTGKELSTFKAGVGVNGFYFN